MTVEKPTPIPPDRIDVDQLKKDTAIDRDNLSQDLQNHTAMFIFYANLAVNARQKHDMSKLLQETTEAKLEQEYRAILKEENPKTTEGQIRSAVVTDARYITACAKVINANAYFRAAEFAAGCFSAREQMLLQLARDARAEGASMRVMTGASTEASVSGAKDRYLAGVPKAA